MRSNELINEIKRKFNLPSDRQAALIIKTDPNTVNRIRAQERSLPRKNIIIACEILGIESKESLIDIAIERELRQIEKENSE